MAKKVVSQSPVPYEAVMLFWRMVTQIFFREIRPRGAFNIPRSGPVIFVAAPHHNQFLDPLLLSLEVWRETHRSVQFLAAAKSMKRKDVGFFIKMMNSIPVERAADAATSGVGKIWLSLDDPCLILGDGTQFTKDFTPRMQIMLPKSVNSALAEVSEVISDTELRIKREFGGESGKGTARIREKVEELRKEGVQGLEYKKLPFVDQQEMYRHVYQALKNGGSIGIFPEGGSHDRTDLLPLKAGVSIMALGAMANDPSVQVKIVPVGLSYFHAHRFRSRAVVEFGAALDVPTEYVEMFKEGGAKKREAVANFLELIYNSLKTVTVRAPDYDTLMLIQAVRRLYKTPGQHLTLGQVVTLNRRLLEGYTHFKDEPRVQKLRGDVLKYNRMVRDLGLRDHQVPRAKKAGWKSFGLLTYRLEALAASVVKVAGRDVLATWKVLIALGVTPILYTIYAIIATIIAIRAKAPLKWRILTPFITIFSLPFMNYASLKFGEAGMDVLKSLPPLIVALVPGQQRSLDKLKATREHLSNEVASLINDFGPRLYEDFDETRIVVPSASAPPSGGSSGIWRRKSSVGAVDAQGLGLTHPMTWLDERLFGWSQSARRGTSAWGGHDDISRVATPDESEEEDNGDYDNVVGILHDDGLARTRSRNSSYADLQRLRMSGMISAKSAEATSTAVPQPKAASHRTRRPSLSNDVPVERLAQIPGEEPFPEVTKDLNKEMTRSKST
ncbi:glycerol-3-phosphate O-acyltransferase [Coprinopsis cinerea okayama7|uniref:Glycerol-3-phosphate O-acyltransferase n=1 Tax=Coprinopsis cinerea (strain Okayama-7 / 130 / ATCC MYA-4618 / FGSC 9003) TaxID=240176 RepID=A8NFI8_COPC7|nr:glycerol-3-phosphate O-acyltransferase [Coprinopsis cinerea okayama7\|eukprot:XP_001833295.2 glycerol-3-phosphate O-acyltransferase [Coprinopsis cinerea okayama7\